ncbi:MAG: hypothetical protein CM1200mP9_03830 [Gammaproteobacteria bacterium]|nr:MAG: hypothetical protein CM1200mP9_03830 [Gammaproteobacteria bacterium]
MVGVRRRCFVHNGFGADVTGVDADRDIFPFLDVIAALNSVKIRPHRTHYEKLTARYLGDHELIIGSDICFWDNLIKPLRKPNCASAAWRYETYCHCRPW